MLQSDLKKNQKKKKMKYDPKVDIVQEIENHGAFQIVSLGDHCLVAKYLSLFELRNCSYPFDWIQSSSVMVLDCLKNKFEAFLQLDAEVVYSKMIGKEVFCHHNVEKSLDYHKRCVARFNNLQHITNKAFVATCYRIEINIWEQIQDILNKNYNISCPIHVVCLGCDAPLLKSDKIHVHHWHHIRTSRADLTEQDQKEFVKFYQDIILSNV